MLGVRYLVTPPRRRMPAEDWQPVLEAGGARVWRLRDPLPLFFVPERVVAVADSERERLASFRTRDFAERTVVSDPAGGRGIERPLPTSDQEGRVWLREVRPNGFELTARSERGAVSRRASGACAAGGSASTTSRPSR